MLFRSEKATKKSEPKPALAPKEEKKKEPKKAKADKPKEKAKPVAKTASADKPKETKKAKADKPKEGKKAKADKSATANKPKEKEKTTAKTETKTVAPIKATGTTSTSKFALPYKTWAITVNGSFTNPYTDLKYRRFLGVSSPKNEYQWGVGLGVTHMFDGAFGIMGLFNAGALQGVADSNMDSKFDYRAMVAAGIDPSGNFFKANFYEGSVNLYWDITNTVFGINRMIRARNSGMDYKPRWVSLYSFAGIGYNYTNTKVYKLKTGLEDTSSFFHTGGNGTLVIPVGVGLKFKLSKSIDLGIEASWHFTFTDKLDGVEYEHHNNKQRDDYYSMVGLSLTWKLGTRKRDKEHIEWRHPQESIYNDLARIEKRVDKLYKDTDGDGVSDVFDKDNETPAGAKVYGDGTSLDTDGDGVPDMKDTEPFTDPGAKVDENGKAIDSDGDGVPDHKDLEPNTPKNSLVNFQGISLDNKYATKDDLAKLRDANHGGNYFPSIYFEFNQANIDRQYEDELQSIAKIMRENKGMVLKVIGYCDVRGTDPYNDDLGMRRAHNIIDYMVRIYGFDKASFEPISIGKRQHEKAEHWVNRRADFIAK